MALYTAQQLDSRNIGSVVKFKSDGTLVHGILELMEVTTKEVELTLQGGDVTYLLLPTDKVDVILTSEAAFALHGKNALEQMRDMLAEVLPSFSKPALQLVGA